MILQIINNNKIYILNNQGPTDLYVLFYLSAHLTIASDAGFIIIFIIL